MTQCHNVSCEVTPFHSVLFHTTHWHCVTRHTVTYDTLHNWWPNFVGPARMIQFLQHYTHITNVLSIVIATSTNNNCESNIIIHLVVFCPVAAAEALVLLLHLHAQMHIVWSYKSPYRRPDWYTTQFILSTLCSTSYTGDWSDQVHCRFRRTIHHSFTQSAHVIIN